ncbi:hypothetical protein PI23P_10240 [Polaribacter irgensii 23-P]|uniref:Uncharacterized protein n=1 Tax=Polaribacter irgensii 23-P TaxID=313594 RepID=A4C0Q7_9FLAO|nr:hypothetical protein [Polaribacter irgensii]EAR13000.1 hypothetical protein PI23P_10240 [Polaribacter irgensii 23-P]
MKRVIVDFAKLTADILGLLITKYPKGYGNSDIISFKNTKGETIKTLEVKTEETIYLVKISERLEQTMEAFAEDEDSFDENEDLDFDTLELEK